jgi:hypothetical protein
MGILAEFRQGEAMRSIASQAAAATQDQVLTA